jgi:hypothetical protein
LSAEYLKHALAAVKKRNVICLYHKNTAVEGDELNESFEGFSHRHREGLISAISTGLFFVLAGAIFLTTPNLFDSIVKFFSHIELVHVPNLGELRLPAPVTPARPWTESTAYLAARKQVYSAAEQFSYIWGLLQVVILALRVAARSPLKKDAETVSNIVFWLGTGFLIRTFLLETIRLPLLTEVARWFVFWSGIIILIGVSLIIRAIILAVVPTRRLT